MATTRLSLAQQIAQFDDPVPVDFDPEDPYARPDDSDEDEAAPNVSAARSHYLDVGPSALRKLHEATADPKYEGVRTSRKQIQQHLEASALEDEDEEGWRDDDGADSQSIVAPEDDYNENSDMASDRPPSDEEDEESEEDDNTPPTPPQQDTSTIEHASTSLRQKREEDIKKGKAISRQITLWDSLLDARIRLQKTATAANRLPTPSDLARFTSDPACKIALDQLAAEALLLSDELLQFRENVLEANDTIEPPPRKRRRTSEGSADLLELKAVAADAAALDEVYHPHLVQTLAKWSAKVQAVAPKVLMTAGRTSFSQKSNNNIRSAPALVDDALLGPAGEKLLARTRIRRGKTSRIGEGSGPGAGEEDLEGFDDTDFYQQLLREVIDARAGDGADADWVAVQKAKKAKKVVDTKASKGRRLRYEVHEKLQNFMVPVIARGQWHEEQIDELFASLLGKGFEHAVAPMDEDDQVAVPVMAGGFRIFG